ncbi:hypothetical protein Tco_0381712 [Tanacetum coccineum]
MLNVIIAKRGMMVVEEVEWKMNEEEIESLVDTYFNPKTSISSVAIDEINEDNDVGTSTHTQNVGKRLFLYMFRHEEPQGSDKISRFTKLPLQETMLSQIPTQEYRFEQFPTQWSSFQALHKDLEEIDDVFGSINLSFARNFTQKDVVEDSLRVEDYQLNDMVVDDSVRVDANQDVNHMEVDLSVMVEESQAIVVEESVMVKESYDDVASTDRLDDDSYDATYVYEGSSYKEDSVIELIVNVPDSMFDKNDLDVIDNEEFDSDSSEKSDLESISNSKLRQLRKRKLQEDDVVNKHDFFVGQSFGSNKKIKDRVCMQ